MSDHNCRTNALVIFGKEERPATNVYHPGPAVMIEKFLMHRPMQLFITPDASLTSIPSVADHVLDIWPQVLPVFISIFNNR